MEQVATKPYLQDLLTMESPIKPQLTQILKFTFYKLSHKTFFNSIKII